MRDVNGNLFAISFTYMGGFFQVWKEYLEFKSTELIFTTVSYRMALEITGQIIRGELV